MSDYKAMHVIEALRSGVPSRTVSEVFSEARPGMLKKIRDGSFDGIVMAYSCFEQIPLSQQYYGDTLQDALAKIKELDKLTDSIDNYQKRLNDAAQAYIEGKLDLVAFSIVQEKANERIKSLKADALQIEMASSTTKTDEEYFKKLLANIDDLMNDRLPDHEFEDMLWTSLKRIRCFYDYVEIETIYGKFKLNRYMKGNARNFPRFTYEVIYPKQQDSCLDTKIHLTYVYGKGTARKLVAELGNLVVFSMG